MEKKFYINTPGPIPSISQGRIEIRLKADDSSRKELIPFEAILQELFTSGGLETCSGNRKRGEKAIILAGTLKQNPAMEGLIFQSILTGTNSDTVYWYMTLMMSSLFELREKYYLLHRGMFGHSFES